MKGTHGLGLLELSDFFGMLICIVKSKGAGQDFPVMILSGSSVRASICSRKNRPTGLA